MQSTALRWQAMRFANAEAEKGEYYDGLYRSSYGIRVRRGTTLGHPLHRVLNENG